MGIFEGQLSTGVQSALGLYIPFCIDLQVAVTAGAPTGPATLGGQYTNWGYGLTNPERGMAFLLPGAFTKLGITAGPHANSFSASQGRLQIYRAASGAALSTGTLITGADLTWNAGETAVKTADLTGLSLGRGDSILVFVGVENLGGTGTFDYLRGGLLFS